MEKPDWNALRDRAYAGGEILPQHVIEQLVNSDGGDMLTTEEQECLVAATGNRDACPKCGIPGQGGVCVRCGWDGRVHVGECGTVGDTAEERYTDQFAPATGDIVAVKCSSCGAPRRPSCNCPGLDGDHPPMDGSAPVEPENFPTKKIELKGRSTEGQVAYWMKKMAEYHEHIEALNAEMDDLRKVNADLSKRNEELEGDVLWFLRAKGH